MQEFFLEAQSRTVHGRGVRALRRTGVIPAVVYGHGTHNSVVQLDAPTLQRVWQAAGESTLIDLSIDKQAPVKAIIQDVQRDPTTDRIVHVDFHQVKMTEKIEVDIPLEFTGEAPAVKELGGTLIKILDSLKVECLPGDLVKSVPVDIAVLHTFDDAIHVKDLDIPVKLGVKDSPDEIVAQVEPPRSEEELKALEEKVEADVSQVQVVEKEPKAEAEAEAEAEVKEEPAAK